MGLRDRLPGAKARLFKYRPPGRAPHGAASSVLSVLRCMNRVWYHPEKAADRSPDACIPAECPARSAESFFRHARFPADGSPVPANDRNGAGEMKKLLATPGNPGGCLAGTGGLEKCRQLRRLRRVTRAFRASRRPRRDTKNAFHASRRLRRDTTSGWRHTRRARRHAVRACATKARGCYGIRSAQRCAMIPKPLARASVARSLASCRASPERPRASASWAWRRRPWSS